MNHVLKAISEDNFPEKLNDFVRPGFKMTQCGLYNKNWRKKTPTISQAKTNNI